MGPVIARIRSPCSRPTLYSQRSGSRWVHLFLSSRWRGKAKTKKLWRREELVSSLLLHTFPCSLLPFSFLWFHFWFLCGRFFQPLVRLFRRTMRFYPSSCMTYPALIFNFSVVAPPPRRSLSPPSSLPPPSQRLLALSRFSDRIYFDLLSSDGSSLQRAHSPISPAGRSSPRHLRVALLRRSH